MADWSKAHPQKRRRETESARRTCSARYEEATSYVAAKALREGERLEGQIRAIEQELIRSIAGRPAARPGFPAGAAMKGLLKGVVDAEDIEAAKRSLFGTTEQDRR